MHTPIDQVFGAGGFLAASRPDYKPRPGQISLATAVDSAIAKAGTVLLAQAPTGTGKSYGYLVPAIWHAVQQGKRVVVATANIALQEQLCGKDLPHLAKTLPWSFRFALAKGMGNYLCLRQLEAQGPDASRFGVGDRESDEQWPEVAAWAKSTTRGDLSELPFVPTQAVKLKIVTNSDDCIGKKCAKYEQCHAMRARREVLAAQIVVTNYHLFFADLMLKAASEGAAGVLPAYDVVIMDEGHAAADIARDFLGFRITLGAVKWATRLLHRPGKNGHTIDEGLQQRVQWAAGEMFEQLTYLAKSDLYHARLRDSAVLEGARWEPLCAVLVDAAASLAQAAESQPFPSDLREDIRRGAARCLTLSAQIRTAMTLQNADTWVYFLEPAGQGVAIMAKPIDVAPMLRDMLFDGSKTVAITSATLAVDGSFEHVSEDLGVEDPETLTVPSPFDWARQALIVVPAGIPEPKDGAFTGAACEAVADVVAEARGRTLVLTTSNRMLGKIKDRLREERFPFPILAQGDAPRSELLRRFRDETDSVLVGTDSFWEGVDVPGESCSCVVIDRLPFEHPNDPVLDAVASRSRNWFMHWSVPRAVIALCQGAGRLIRSDTDRGVVVILDRRFVDKPYGKVFRNSLPDGVRISNRTTDVGKFLA